MSFSNVREFHIHVLVSAPAKDNSLYPYSFPRPSIYSQDILVLLSEQANPDAPRVLRSSSISHTQLSSKAFISWHTDPKSRPVATRHLWVKLFARAQGQYLFPNSSDHPGKRPLSDARLCAWWRQVLGQGRVDAYYVLPGHNELEAQQVMGVGFPPPSSSSVAVQWVYGHPYGQTRIPLPCPRPEGLQNLGHYIPSFEDDPQKSVHGRDRVYRHTPVSPRKRARTDPPQDGDGPQSREGAKEKEKKEARPKGELGKVGPDEFWERMSFRQECVAGAVTGFFALGVSVPEHRMPSSRPPPLAPQPGQVPRAMNRRVLSSLLTGVEFSTQERAHKATELIEGAQLPAPKPKNQNADATPGSLAPPLPKTPPRRTVGLPAVDDISPNPFDEPEATLETYRAFIYGSVTVSNPPPPLPSGAGSGTASEGAAPEDKAKVHVLTARKKKKRPDA
ncbi:histone acetylation protein-domain-containing protein [Lactarius hengduanensis]|nr:histone acetylation protein-domain-containing protein [Lactarius hengduanensis]